MRSQRESSQLLFSSYFVLFKRIRNCHSNPANILLETNLYPEALEKNLASKGLGSKNQCEIANPRTVPVDIGTAGGVKIPLLPMANVEIP